jgi:AcrR family transcriptional regulator
LTNASPHREIRAKRRVRALTMATPKIRGAAPARAGGRRRREQQRSVDSRIAILRAALTEFAEKGFDGASMRNIGERAGLHYTLITYHFRNKDLLWRATAEHFFSEINAMWDEEVPQDGAAEPIDRIRREFRGLLRFEIEHPDFHHFMVRENRVASPRLPWLVDTFLAPVMHRLIPQIEAAQRDGDLPPAHPVLIHYLLIGITSVLSSLGAEIRHTSGLDLDDPKIADEYWALIEALVFRRKPYWKAAADRLPCIAKSD